MVLPRSFLVERVNVGSDRKKILNARWRKAGRLVVGPAFCFSVPGHSP